MLCWQDEEAKSSLEDVPEWSYLTQFVFMVKEDLSKEASSEDRYTVEILASPGIKSRDSLLKGEEFPPAKSPHEPFKKKSSDSSAIRIRLKRKSCHTISVQEKIRDKRKMSSDDMLGTIIDFNMLGVSTLTSNYSENALSSASEVSIHSTDLEDNTGREKRASSDSEVHEEDLQDEFTIRRKSSLENACDRLRVTG